MKDKRITTAAQRFRPNHWVNTRFQAGSVIDVSALSSVQYHQAPGLSASSVKNCGNMDMVMRPPEHSSAALTVGTATNDAILYFDQFEERFPIGPTKTKTTKAWKEWVTTLKPWQIPLNKDEAESVLAMRRAVLRHPVGSVLVGGPDSVAEPSIFASWDDRVLLKCRPDILIRAKDGKVTVVDIKTAADASPEAFRSAVFRFKYHVSVALTTDIIKQALGVSINRYTFLVVDKRDPKPERVALYDLDLDFIEEGRMVYMRAAEKIDKYISGKEKNKDIWSGWPTSVQKITMKRSSY